MVPAHALSGSMCHVSTAQVGGGYLSPPLETVSTPLFNTRMRQLTRCAATRHVSRCPVAPSHVIRRNHSPSHRANASASSTPAPVWGEDPQHSEADYICLGLAQCYVKDESSKLQEILVIEPIPAGGLECMDNGGSTSYLFATAVPLGVALQQDITLLPPEFRVGRFCEEFEYRTLCAGRTWKRQHAQEKLQALLPIGSIRSDFNFSVEDKRVLNMEHVVNDTDNIKQDLSIDVYGRAKEEGAGPDKEIEKLYNA